MDISSGGSILFAVATLGTAFDSNEAEALVARFAVKNNLEF
jgi:hypothetical protein